MMAGVDFFTSWRASDVDDSSESADTSSDVVPRMVLGETWRRRRRRRNAADFPGLLINVLFSTPRFRWRRTQVGKK